MNEQEDDPDVYYIGRSESHIDVANWIYEFINLEHPDAERHAVLKNADGPYCNPSAMDVLKKKLEAEEPREKGRQQSNLERTWKIQEPG